jgi:predicted RNase H-like HicB family nuclease
MASEYILLTLRAYPEGKQWVSECLELGTTSCGDTIEEALESVKDATLLYLQTIEANGTRERILKEKGVPIVSGDPPSLAEVHGRARPNEVLSPYVHKVPARTA